MPKLKATAVPWFNGSMHFGILLVGAMCLFPLGAMAGSLTTNAVQMPAAPGWLTTGRVNRIVDRVQRTLEWDIRRVTVRWHASESDFAASHGLKAGGSTILAVSRKNDNTIHLGPLVTASNFDGVFGHELAHIVMYQKYKDAIPKWLEEGLANYASGKGEIDYRWLSLQPAVDVRALAHPFGESSVSVKYHYMASTALVELLKSRCRMADLLQLSVGKGLESYLSTFCRIKDLNDEFRRFIRNRAGR